MWSKPPQGNGGTVAVRRVAASSRIAQEPGVRQRGSGVEAAEGSPLVAQGLQRCEQCWRRGCDNVRGGPAFVQLQFAFGCHSCGLADCWDGSPGCTFVGRERVRRADASQTRPDETRRDEMEGGGQGVCPRVGRW